MAPANDRHRRRASSATRRAPAPAAGGGAPRPGRAAAGRARPGRGGRPRRAEQRDATPERSRGGAGRGAARPAPTQRRTPERTKLPLRDPAKLLERMPWNSLRPLLVDSEADREVALARLRLFALELLRWNQGVSNLISHDDEPRLVERHIAESLAGLKVINDLGCSKLVDFGSGGGFPAIPLALAGVGRQWKLVESRRNKTLFLRRAIQGLALAGAEVVTGRLEALIAEDPTALRCDGFTSRATMKAGPTLAMAARIVEPGGHALLWKGSAAAEELVATSATWQRSWLDPVVHPIGDGPNAIFVFERKQTD